MPAPTERRKIYMVLSPRALSYAYTALDSLFRRSAEPLDLSLITDSEADKQQLRDTLSVLSPARHHSANVFAEEELNDAEADRFAGLDRLRAFRHGHPCWRKVTDPLLLGAPGEEMVLLDPDLYFPNQFTFEATPGKGLSLMWQRPNCMLPPHVVRAAMNAGIALARHVDIGVSHWRSGGDLAWLDWMLSKLGQGSPLPRVMHVEAIVWSAIAMKEGGGYLDPGTWVCWHRTQAKRLRRKLGTSGERLLNSEPWQSMKCFHAGGEAKWWVTPYAAAHPQSGGNEVLAPSPLRPFVELTRTQYENEQRAKNMLHHLGYYRVFGAKAP